MRVAAGGLLGVVALTLVGCDTGNSSPTAPSTTTTTVRFDYRASTSLNANLPVSTQACVSSVGRTHIHPSWRGFERIDLQAVGADLWQITFTDVPLDVRLSLRVSDPNVCTENPTGAGHAKRFRQRRVARGHRADARVWHGAGSGVHRGRRGNRDAVVPLSRSLLIFT